MRDIEPGGAPWWIVWVLGGGPGWHVSKLQFEPNPVQLIAEALSFIHGVSHRLNEARLWPMEAALEPGNIRLADSATLGELGLGHIILAQELYESFKCFHDFTNLTDY